MPWVARSRRVGDVSHPAPLCAVRRLCAFCVALECNYARRLERPSDPWRVGLRVGSDLVTSPYADPCPRSRGSSGRCCHNNLDRMKKSFWVSAPLALSHVKPLKLPK